MIYSNEHISGYVEDIVFRNEENGYTVLRLNNNGEQSSVVGCFHYINPGEYLEAAGYYSEHTIYGPQFNVESYEIKMPTDVASYERYLGSGAIKGMGPALAARVVAQFGEDTFRIMEEEPECLAKVRGISNKKALEFGMQFAEKKDMRDAMVFLQRYGISIRLAAKIYLKYNNQVYQIINENPYKIAEEIQGVGFKTADEIAAKVGIGIDSDYRIRCGLLYVLGQAIGEGHTYLPEHLLLDNARRILGVEEEPIKKSLMDLTIDRKIITKEYKGELCYYDIRYYYMEMGVASKLHMLSELYDIDEAVLGKRITKVEEAEGIKLDDKQILAVTESFRNGLTIITGGPGTGKTTTINTIIKCFEAEQFEIALAAPTGRAAKRMSEATGYEAKTIHRLLEAGGLEESAGFGKNEENPIEADLVIIDEMSMVDISLMNSLLKAMLPGSRLILVGDVNQLPSVGAGNVLRDIIESGCFGVVKLEHIFRQAQLSDIVVNAHKINAGQVPVTDNKSEDFFLLKRYNPEQIINVMRILIQEKLPKYLDCKTTDIQILTPMRKGNMGVENLNVIFQSYMNPPEQGKAEVEINNCIFREGDKVMQTKNNYHIEWEVKGMYGIPVESGMGVFNGDVGIIKKINKFTELITVEFDDMREVDYSYKDAEELEHAYAITIHKSQGSEYPGVVMPILSGPEMLMTRNLLYTAVTRAKKCVTIVGDEKMFERMVYNDTEKVRYTGLAECIIDLVEEGR